MAEHKEKQKEKMELPKEELHIWQTISEHSQSENDWQNFWEKQKKF